MNRSVNNFTGRKLKGWINDFADWVPPVNGSCREVHYNNPGDVLRFELYTKREFLAMGHSKENVEIITSCSASTVNEVIAQCEAVEINGTIYLRIAELRIKLVHLRLALRFRFSKKQLQRINEVERELEILLAALRKQQRLILLMTRLKDAPGYDKSILRSKYYSLPIPFKRCNDTYGKSSEEELMFIPVTDMKLNFSNTKLELLCIMLTDYSAQSIPLWHLRRTG